MNQQEVRIPEEMASEVFRVAAQLYAQHSQSYSAEELIQAGAMANIPPRFVRQAIHQVRS